jgi:hypothetical protein
VIGAYDRPSPDLGDSPVPPAPDNLGPLATAWTDLEAIAANVRVLVDAARRGVAHGRGQSGRVRPRRRSGRLDGAGGPPSEPRVS